MPQVPVGEAVFFGIWYGTLLALSIAVWIIAIQTIKVATALIGIREWLSHLAIAAAAGNRGHAQNTPDIQQTPCG